MKTLLFLAIIISGTTFAQTNVIAAKSHGSDPTTSPKEMDNFGLPDETRVIQKVEYLKGDCIVETSEVTMFETRIDSDTICDHPFLKKGQVDVDRIKAMYPDNTKFVGFHKLKSDQKAVNKRLKKEKRKKKKSSSLVFFLIGGGLFLTYLFIPKMSTNRA